MGVWVGNKTNQHLDNSITGGSLPTSISSQIWNNLYINELDACDIKKSENVEEVYIDKIEYETSGNIVLADDICPLRYKTKALFKKSMLPKIKSTRFSLPIIEKPKISVNNNEITIQLCLTQYTNAKVYRLVNDNKVEVFDSAKDNECVFVDKLLNKGIVYSYVVVPYCNIDGQIYFGKEIFLEKIKSPVYETDDWWIN